MYSDMSTWMSASSSPNRNSASVRASSVLPTPDGPRKMNEPVGRFGSLMPARARRIALDDGDDRLVLADDALVELVLHPDELLRLGLGELEDGDARPHGDDVGDLVLADLRLLLVGLVAPLLLELLLLLRELALLVAELRGLLELLRLDRRLPCRRGPCRSPPRARGSAAARTSSRCGRASRPRRSGRSPCRGGGGPGCSGRRARLPRTAPRRRSCSGDAPRSDRAVRAGSGRSRRSRAPRRAPAGSGARARRRARGTCGTRRASSRRWSGSRRARAPA